MLWLLRGSTAGTRRNLQHRRSHAEGTTRVFVPWFAACNWQTLGNSQLRNPGQLIFSLPMLSPGAVRPWTWPPPLQRQPAEMLHQAAFDCELSHYRNEIGELRQQNIHYRPLVWTADGRPHPAVTRTLQYAAGIASSRNGQQMSAKSLHRRWKHEIQIALLRRRAAMARAVHPNPSARAEWLFAGIIDRALHHWGHVPAT